MDNSQFSAKPRLQLISRKLLCVGMAQESLLSAQIYQYQCISARDGQRTPPMWSTCALSHALPFFKGKKKICFHSCLHGNSNSVVLAMLQARWARFKHGNLHFLIAECWNLKPGSQGPVRSPLAHPAPPVKFPWVRSLHLATSVQAYCWGTGWFRPRLRLRKWKD